VHGSELCPGGAMGCIIGKPVDCSGSEHQGGIPVDIPERDWGYLKLFEERERDCLKYEPLDAREPYADVKLKRVDVFRLWPEGPSPGSTLKVPTVLPANRRGKERGGH
jgi:hypothetical protein